MTETSAMGSGPAPGVFAEAYLHGTKAQLEPGDLIRPGHTSNFGSRRVANFVYVTGTLDAAVWGAELSVGEGRGRIYVVEVTGSLEDDPNVTDKRFAGNPTRSFRTREPVRVVGEVVRWQGHDAQTLATMRSRVAELAEQGIEHIDE